MVDWAKTHAVGGATNPMLSVHGPDHPHYSSICLYLIFQVSVSTKNMSCCSRFSHGRGPNYPIPGE